MLLIGPQQTGLFTRHSLCQLKWFTEILDRIKKRLVKSERMFCLVDAAVVSGEMVTKIISLLV